MKVRLLKPTFWGVPLKPKDIADIDDAVANRWIERGIAEKATEKGSKGGDKE